MSLGRGSILLKFPQQLAYEPQWGEVGGKVPHIILMMADQQKSLNSDGMSDVLIFLSR
jgi:hypothetical protein